MKLIGSIILWIAFISGSLVATWHIENVYWPAFVGTLALGVVGMFLIRKALKAHATDEVRIEANMSTIKKSLGNIVKNMEWFVTQKDSLNVYDYHEKIDEKMLDDIENFVDARESIVHEYGNQVYADLMSHFSAGERYLNRVWSASADGYIDEVNSDVERSLDQFKITKEHVDQLKARA